jgi:PBP1b-binding outer membrane lipoprotein LpoB
MTMFALNGSAHSQQDTRHRIMHRALLAASVVLVIAGCSNDDASPASSSIAQEQPDQQARISASAASQATSQVASQVASPALTVQTPAQTFNTGASSTTDSVVLAPPVFHTVD